MNSVPPLRLTNGQPAERAALPIVPFRKFREQVLYSLQQDARLAAFYAVPRQGTTFQLVAVMAHGGSGDFSLISTDIEDHYQALTPGCVQAHWFEREIAEQWAITPEGHPWLKPLRFHRSYRKDNDAWNRDPATEILPGVTTYFRVEGEEVHEVAVGPVHAGVIEPGHFRFQCYGERVLHLEISLGYQHRGIERALLGGPTLKTISHMETLAGDTTIGHATAYCQAVEALAGCVVPERAEAIRGIALELERLANHVGDLGALAGDVGYLPTSSYCGRLRGELLNLTALLCGNRFGRNLLRPGGSAFDLEEPRAAELLNRLDRTMRDITGAVTLLWNVPSVLARFEDTGMISRQTALDLGLVGPSVRACGVDRDARRDFPSGIFKRAPVKVAVGKSGDVFARAWVRWLELEHSMEFLRAQLPDLPRGALRADCGPLASESLVVSMVEGWRGEICHVAMTDQAGRIAHYKIVDPSFHNWMGLSMALRNQEISDFPLCNKSFNLSYCGHDL